jgi:hypothetical protein
MKKRVHFNEEQRFRQLWIWIVILGSIGVWIYSMTVQVFMDHDFGNNFGSDLLLILLGILPLLLIYLFFSLKLITMVNKDGVHYRFAPWQRKFKVIHPEDIREYKIRKYRPLIEYGGWGVRQGFRKYGTAYNVSGNIGMQFTLKNGKKFLLGTRKADSFLRAVDKLMERSTVQE